MDDEHSEIKIVASDEEHKQITTNPDEILENEAELAVKEKQRASERKFDTKPSGRQISVKIKVDPEKKFFRHRDLSLHDVKYLIAKGYRQVKCLNISGKTETYLIKPNKNESDSHFLMIQDIAKNIRKFTNKIELYETVRPDIIFEAKGKRYAIEVETGKVLAKDKTKFASKIKNLKSEFGGNWFFVLTNRNLYSVYSKFGKTYHKRNILKKIKECFK